MLATTNIIGDAPCPKCRSEGRDRTGNHLILFKDGGGYCNRCDVTYTYEEIRGHMNRAVPVLKTPPERLSAAPGGAISALLDRGITQEIAEVYGVYSDAERHYYPITLDGDTVGWKVREVATKQFHIEGTGKTNEFFGQHLLRAGGSKLFITEGECDAMALAQALLEGMTPDKVETFGFPPVVSLPHGVSSAATVLTAQHVLLDSFREIVLVPDQDEQGKGMVDAAISVLGRDKLKVVSLPLKDPNEMLQKGMNGLLRMCVISRAKMPTPEEVVYLDDIPLEDLTRPLKPGLAVPQYPGLCYKLHGFRHGRGAGELTVLVAGSGMGKTTLSKEIMYSLRMEHDLTIGEIRLEEGTLKTAQSLIAIHNNISVASLRENPKQLSEDQWRQSYEAIRGDHKVAMLDHFGSLASEKLLDHMRYLANVAQCDFISLDHISMVISGQQNANERKDIDILMTELAAFVETSGVSVIAVVHLRRPGGDTSWNNGAEVSLSMLRGSAALEQLSHNVIAVEGDQRAGDGNRRTITVLKNREWGSIGEAETCIYYPDTGRLLGINSEIHV